MDPLRFDFILKPVGSECNLGCSYCYYLQRAVASKRTERWSVQDGQFIISRISEFEKSRNNDLARVTWHGGEPLLVGIDWFKEINQFQKESGIRFINSIQTNGTLLNKQWIDLFLEMDMTVGLSIDGPNWVHDKQRHNKGGKGVSDHVLNALYLCRENGIHLGVLCVITEESSQYPDDIIDFFLKNNIDHYDFLPAYGTFGTDQVHAVSPNSFTKFMKHAFDWYINYDNPVIKIRTINTVIERWLGGMGGVCTVNGKSCGSFLTIERTGEVSFCDDYNANIFSVLANLKDCSIQEIIESQKFHQYRELSLNRGMTNSICSICDVNFLCNGGCHRNWIGNKNYFCEYYKDFYIYVYNRLRLELGDNLLEVA